MSTQLTKQSPLAWSFILVLLGTAMHLALAFTTELSVDEAHYALYAKHLAWSYFDHPPLVGWIQWPFVAINAPDGILRLIPISIWIISCILVYQIAYQLNDYCSDRGLLSKQIGLGNSALAGLAAVAVIVFAPLPHVLAVGLVPDTLLTPLSLAILWMTLQWIKQDGQFSFYQWIGLGLLFGLAGLSKYTAALYAIAFVIACLTVPRYSFLKQSGFYLAIAIALLLISPVILWNAQHDWISFKYQIDHGSGGTWLWRRVAAFIGLQIAVFGFLPLLGLWAFSSSVHWRTRPWIGILLIFFALPFGVFAILSGGGGLPHWTSPAWFCLAPFAGIGLAKAWATQHRNWIRILFIIQIALCCIGFGYVLSGGISSSSIKSNPIADLYGWKIAGQKAAELTKATKANGIAVQNWTLGSRAAWYASPTPVFVLDQRQDQFDLWFGDLPIGATVLLVNWSGMPHPMPIGSKSAFEACEPLDSLEIKRFGRVLSRFDFSLCQNWQGSSRPE